MRKVTHILIGALLIVSVGGYLLPDSSEQFPDKILMKNTAGRVVFDHKTHVEAYGLDCQVCHHDALSNGQAGQPCKTCHALEFDASFRGHARTMDPGTCATCHHMTMLHKDWGHAAHIDGLGLECSSCHHDTQLEEEPQNCANCHDRDIDMGPILALRNAVHKRCANCHEDTFASQDMTACYTCHVQSASRDMQGSGSISQNALIPCATCHNTEPSRLVPGTMAAYHGRCINCHKEKGGPVDDKDKCAQCHIK